MRNTKGTLLHRQARTFSHTVLFSLALPSLLVCLLSYAYEEVISLKGTACYMGKQESRSERKGINCSVTIPTS